MSNKKSIFYTWLISYIIIASLPIFVGSGLYWFAEQSVREDVIRSNSMLIKNAQYNSDSAINEINNLSNQISVNGEISSLLGYNSKPTNAEFYKISKIRNDLRVYGTSLNYVDEFFVYLEGLDSVLSITNSMSLYDTYTYLYGEPPQDLDGFKNYILTGRALKTKEVSRKTTYSHESSEKIMFIQKLSSNVNSAQGAIIIVLDKSKLLSPEINNPLFYNSAFYILDNKNNIVVSTADNENVDITSLINNNEISKLKINDKENYFIKTESSLSGWKHVVLIPSDNFLKKIYKIRNIALLVLFIYSIMSGLVIRFFLKFNYDPINQLICNITYKENYSFNKKTNEFSFIEEIVSKTFKEKEQYSQTLDTQKNVLKTNFLQRLLKGRVESGIQVQKSFESFGIVPISQYYVVIIVYVDDTIKLFSDDENLNDKERYSLTLFILGNVFTELFSKENYAIATEYNDMLACIVNINPKNLSIINEQLKQAIIEGQKFIQEYFKFSLTLAISDVHQTIEGISEACTEALTAMEYKIIMEDSSIILYENVKNPQNDGYYYPLEKERQLINYIKSGDIVSSKEMIDEIFKANFTEGFMKIHLIKCLMFDIISTMIKTVQEVFGGSEDEFLNNLSPIEKLINCENVFDMKLTINELLTQVCSFVSSKGDQQIKNKVINLVKHDYNNIDLSVSTVANNIGLHPTYLSSVFKEQTGEGVLEYLMSVRIQKSKDLLLNTNKTLEEISNLIGYANVRTFIRVFKKLEGVTPTKFKEISK